MYLNKFNLLTLRCCKKKKKKQKTTFSVFIKASNSAAKVTPKHEDLTWKKEVIVYKLSNSYLFFRSLITNRIAVRHQNSPSVVVLEENDFKIINLKHCLFGE